MLRFKQVSSVISSELKVNAASEQVRELCAHEFVVVSGADGGNLNPENTKL